MANETGYSDAQILRMQQDAVRRVKEMQRRSNAAVSPERGRQQQNSGTQQNRPSQQSQHAQHQNTQNRNGGRRGNLSFEERGKDGRHHGHQGSHEQNTTDTKEQGGAFSDLLGGLGIGGDSFKLDSDTLLLLGLAYLLYKNGASLKLVLALLYIML